MEREPGKGAAFGIYLPHAPEIPERRIAEPAVVEMLTGQGTVLLVEDEPVVLRLVRDLLAENGYRVLAASSGSDALSIARKETETIHMSYNGRGNAGNERAGTGGSNTKIAADDASALYVGLHGRRDAVPQRTARKFGVSAEAVHAAPISSEGADDAGNEASAGTRLSVTLNFPTRRELALEWSDRAGRQARQE